MRGRSNAPSPGKWNTFTSVAAQGGLRKCEFPLRTSASAWGTGLSAVDEFHETRTDKLDSKLGAFRKTILSGGETMSVLIEREGYYWERLGVHDVGFHAAPLEKHDAICSSPAIRTSPVSSEQKLRP